jgi:hypothetical protein
MSDADSRQVGGSHYKVPGGEEHWNRVARLGLDYWQAAITKYVERWKKKGGVQDLQKAAHYLQKYIELAEAGKLPVTTPPQLGVYVDGSEPGRGYVCQDPDLK